jgi:hypothetical protein
MGASAQAEAGEGDLSCRLVGDHPIALTGTPAEDRFTLR